MEEISQYPAHQSNRYRANVRGEQLHSTHRLFMFGEIHMVDAVEFRKQVGHYPPAVACIFMTTDDIAPTVTSHHPLTIIRKVVEFISALMFSHACGQRHTVQLITCQTIDVDCNVQQGQYGGVQEDEQLVVRVFVQLNLDGDERRVGVRHAFVRVVRHGGDVGLITRLVEEVDLHLVDKAVEDRAYVTVPVGVAGCPTAAVGTDRPFVRPVHICCRQRACGKVALLS